MQKKELTIVALSHSITQSHNYAVVLGEVDGDRRLPIVIGGFEAQAIAVAMEKMAPKRPLTHDLFKNVLLELEVDLKEVIINNLVDGIFFAQLVCDKNGLEVSIDSRTSDALALAVRFECPIYTYEFILETAGIVLEDADIEGVEEEEEQGRIDESDSDSIEKMPLEDLEMLLDEVLKEEDYERAVQIRDEINNRSKK